MYCFLLKTGLLPGNVPFELIFALRNSSVFSSNFLQFVYLASMNLFSQLDENH